MLNNLIGTISSAVELKPHTFKTGSKGFLGQGKVIQDGIKYQVQVMAVQVNSKPQPKS